MISRPMIGNGSDFVTRNRAPVFLSEKHNLAQLMKCFIIASVNDETPAADELTIRAIGHIRSGKSVKFQALHQPDEQADGGHQVDRHALGDGLGNGEVGAERRRQRAQHEEQDHR